METILGFALLGLAVIVSTIISNKSKEKYHIRPKLAFATVTIVGRTEESETMQLSASLMEDESVETWNGKLNKLFEMREQRLGFQNTRLMEIQKEHEKVLAEEKAKLAADPASKKPSLVK